VSETTTRTYRVGERVTPDPSQEGIPQGTIGRVFTVAKVNPVNIKCTADDGGRGINFPAHCLLPATEENLSPTGARPFVPREFYSVGEVVTLARPYKEATTDTPFVVIADKGRMINVALLGGENDRYVRVPSTGLVKRDLTWLAQALLEEVTA
jgi:hypothetical protein